MHSLAVASKVSLPYGIRLQIKSKENKYYSAIEDLNTELISVNADLRIQVEEKTRDTRAVLSNLSQGIFTVEKKGSNFLISEDYSTALAEIVDRVDLAGKSPITEIFERCDLEQEQIDILKSSFLLSFGEDRFQWDLLADSLPKQFHLNDKLIECSFDAIADHAK